VLDTRVTELICFEVMPSSTVPGYTKKHYEVWRRFSDFLGLHEKLHSKHLPNGVIVPPPPEKSVVGMTKAKMSKTVDDDHGTSEFLERRRSSLQRFIRRVALHSTLISVGYIRAKNCTPVPVKSYQLHVLILVKH
jgi:sorting nexin-1/2